MKYSTKMFQTSLKTPHRKKIPLEWYTSYKKKKPMHYQIEKPMHYQIHDKQ